MCGILGAIPADDSPLFRQALARLAHRGPDGEAVWHHPEGKVSLGHRRLAIIDRGPGGAQPMHRNALHITSNSEIYNYRELRQRLQALGHQFVTESDTEVFLATWQQWSQMGLLECNGMWAFGMWDEEHQRLILARDRFGKQPLYYLQQGERLYFASEMKALFPFLDQVRPADNFREMAADLRGYESTDQCLIAGIKRFPAGHWGEFRNGRLQFFRFWHTLDHLEEVPESYEAQVGRFRELWDEACSLRLRSDVPVGVALSGGLDSAAVLGTVTGMQSDTQAFTVGFPGTPFDEVAAAQSVARAHSAPLRELIAEAPTPEVLRQQLRLFGELHDNCLSPKVALYAGMRNAGRMVSLDGHGADEAMAGYGEGLFHAFGDAGWRINDWRSIVDAFNHYYPDDPQFTKPKAGLTTALAYRLGGGGNELPEEWKKLLGHHGAYLYELFHRSIFPVMLRNYDRYAMMNGVEIRMPFTDHRLVSYLFSLPWKAKLRQGFTKVVLRDAMQGRVPDAVRLKREKLGFPTPITKWMKGPWREFLLDFVASRAVRESDLGDAKAVTAELKTVLENPNVNYFAGLQLWGRLSPFLWEWAVLR